MEIRSLGSYKKRVTLETNGLFQFKHTSPVRFQDLDAGGHVHHSVALCFFEEAREAYPIQVKVLSEVEPGLFRIEPISYLNELQPTQT